MLFQKQFEEKNRQLTLLLEEEDRQLALLLEEKNKQFYELSNTIKELSDRIDYLTQKLYGRKSERSKLSKNTLANTNHSNHQET